MIWLSWRQFRVQAYVALGLLAAVLVVLLVTGVHHDSGAAAAKQYRSLRLLGTGLIGVPALIGAFWGAPLVARELETGTHRLAWTQSVTRTRWLGTKLVLVGAVSAFVSVVFSLALGWWSRSFDPNASWINSGLFGQRGIAPLGYAVFMVAVGVLLGAMMRRTVPAMAVTLVVFFVARYAVQTWVRPHLFHTHTVNLGVQGFNDPTLARGDIVSAHTVDRHGHVLGPSAGYVRDSVLPRLCGLTTRGDQTDGKLAACAHRLGVHDVVSVRLPNQFWPVQVWETAIFLLLAAACVGVCFWWVRKRLV
jgi:hypothetical protein